MCTGSLTYSKEKIWEKMCKIWKNGVNQTWFPLNTPAHIPTLCGLMGNEESWCSNLEEGSKQDSFLQKKVFPLILERAKLHSEVAQNWIAGQISLVLQGFMWMEKALPWILPKKNSKRTSGGSHQDLLSKLQVKGETFDS